ncbi:MAG TPA: GTP cyclohydrolase I FolE [Candidatus Goldiibacteriota bacterium]|nr:GTP cyclohydrolase I FolE [Candidatus Goldiibacteriota bacterium]
MDKEKIKKAVTMILEAIGEDTGREGLKNTPERVADMYEEIFAGINQKPEEFIKIFEEDEHEELIILKDIPFYSVCEHHLMPFLGKAHIGYIPKKNRLLGLSKIARMVEMFAKRLQLQERLTSQVADTIMKAVDPLGVIVIIEAQHLCTTMRGVKKPGSVMVTSAIRGIFKDDESARKEALGLINK